jgi:hypothetical protein
LGKALDRINQSTTPLLGMVVNSVTTRASSGAYYYRADEKQRRRFVRHRNRKRKRGGGDDGTMGWQELITATPETNGGRSPGGNGSDRQGEPQHVAAQDEGAIPSARETRDTDEDAR